MKHASIKALGTTFFVTAAALTGFAVLFASPVMAKTAATTASTDGSDMTDDSDLRLALDKVDLYIQSGNYDAAHDLIEKLKTKYPNNAEVMAAEADINGERVEERGDTIKVVSDLCAPSSLEPNALDLLQRENLTSSSAKNFACADYNRRIDQQSLEQIESLTGQVAVPYPGTRIMFDLENDHVNSEQPFQYSHDTNFDRSFYGDRQQGTVMLEKTFTSHIQAGLSLYGSDDNAGGGGQLVYRDPWGGTSVMVDYAKPDWDYIEMLTEDGTKNDIHVERKMVFNENLQAVLSGGYSMYSLQTVHDAAEAPGWNFGLDYARPVKLFEQGDNDDAWYNDQFTIGGHYGVEAEYFTFVKREYLTPVDFFHPLPTTSYEVHSFTGSIGKTILNNIDAELEGGYGVDRISGSSGPVYGGSLTYTPIQNLGIDVHASRTLLGGQNNGEKEDIVGGSVKWLW